MKAAPALRKGAGPRVYMVGAQIAPRMYLFMVVVAPVVLLLPLPVPLLLLLLPSSSPVLGSVEDGPRPLSLLLPFLPVWDRAEVGPAGADTVSLWKTGSGSVMWRGTLLLTWRAVR
jgi:hypothetical protein